MWKYTQSSVTAKDTHTMISWAWLEASATNANIYDTDQGRICVWAKKVAVYSNYSDTPKNYTHWEFKTVFND